MIGISTTISTLLAFCGAVAIVGGAMTYLYKVIRPAISLVERVEKLEQINKENEDLMDTLISSNKYLLKSILAMMESAINGNNIENLKKTKAELQDFIINNNIK